MSKAFASNESEEDDNTLLLKAPVLPPGTPNYMTAAGAERLSAERARLIAEKTSLGDAVEHQTRRRVLERRIDFLTDRLNSAQIVDPAGQAADRVRFGAEITVADAQGQEQTWRIVGVDEIDLEQRRISWISPLARALLDKSVGDTAVIGEQRWLIRRISY